MLPYGDDTPLPDNNRLFSQSRLLNALNWSMFYQHYTGNLNQSNNPITVKADEGACHTTVPYPCQDNERLMIAFNRVHFHRQIYDALSCNPLSTLYSMAWSLCLHIEGQSNEEDPFALSDWINNPSAPYPSDAEYLRIWSPFILLHRMTMQFIQLLAPQPVTEPNQNDSLFTLEDLRQADSRCRDSLRYMVHGNNPQPGDTSTNLADREARLARQHTQLTAYLSSPLFKQLCEKTPYGFGEIRADTGQDSYRLHFVDNLSKLADKQKMRYDFFRYQAYEPLRIRTEKALQARFPRYHEKHGMYLNSWLFGSICHNEMTATVESNERSYIMYWQLQKSTLLWILVHALFALNAALEERMMEDLLCFVAHQLARFIECGVCYAHWTDVNNGGELEWQKQEAAFIARRDIDNSKKKTATLTPLTPPLFFDNGAELMMLMTHNTIQMQQIHADTGLTTAALHALRVDYAHFAGAFIGCLVADSLKPSTTKKPASRYRSRLPFRCNVYDFEQARGDLCRTAPQIYCTAMQRSTAIQNMANNEAAIVSYKLALEWHKIHRQVNGT